MNTGQSTDKRTVNSAVQVSQQSDNSASKSSKTSRLISWLPGWLGRVTTSHLTRPAGERVRNQSELSSPLSTNWVYMADPAGAGSQQHLSLHHSDPNVHSALVLPAAADQSSRSQLAAQLATANHSQHSVCQLGLMSGLLQSTGVKPNLSENSVEALDWRLCHDYRIDKSQSATQLISSFEPLPQTLTRSRSVVSDWLTLGICPYKRRQQRLLPPKRRSLRRNSGSKTSQQTRSRVDQSPESLDDITFSRSSLPKLSSGTAPVNCWNLLQHLTGESFNDTIHTSEIIPTDENLPANLRTSYSADTLSSFGKGRRLPGLGNPTRHVSSMDSTTTFHDSQTSQSATDVSCVWYTDGGPAKTTAAVVSGYCGSPYVTRHQTYNKSVNNQTESHGNIYDCAQIGKTFSKYKHPKQGDVKFYLNSIPEIDNDSSTLRTKHSNARSLGKTDQQTEETADTGKLGVVGTVSPKIGNVDQRFSEFNISRANCSLSQRTSVTTDRHSPDHKQSQQHSNSKSGKLQPSERQWNQSSFKDDYCYSNNDNLQCCETAVDSTAGLMDAIPSTVSDLNRILATADRTLRYTRISDRLQSTQLYRKPSGLTTKTDTIESIRPLNNVLLDLADYSCAKETKHASCHTLNDTLGGCDRSHRTAVSLSDCGPIDNTRPHPSSCSDYRKLRRKNYKHRRPRHSASQSDSSQSPCRFKKQLKHPERKLTRSSSSNSLASSLTVNVSSDNEADNEYESDTDKEIAVCKHTNKKEEKTIYSSCVMKRSVTSPIISEPWRTNSSELTDLPHRSAETTTSKAYELAFSKQTYKSAEQVFSSGDIYSHQYQRPHLTRNVKTQNSYDDWHIDERSSARLRTDLCQLDRAAQYGDTGSAKCSQNSSTDNAVNRAWLWRCRKNSVKKLTPAEKARRRVVDTQFARAKVPYKDSEYQF